MTIEDEIRLLELDTISAQKWAHEGRIEEWVHRYLMIGKGGDTNPEFSAGLKREKRWWNGPFEVKLNELSPAVGPEPGMEYVVDSDTWRKRTSDLAETLTTPLSLPPLIVEYREGELSIRDGNTRYGAMKHLGWSKCWVIIWYNTENDLSRHSETISDGKI